MPISEAQTDNNPQAYKAKIDIRKRVFEAVAASSEAVSVFDAFAGSGEMFTGAWHEADKYVGCGLKYQADKRLMFAADNRRVMRAIDLRQFNVFDLDAYGSPWEQAMIIADRRPVKAGEVLGLAITEGAGLSYKSNVLPHAVRVLTGLRPGIVGLGRKQDDLIHRTIVGLAQRMRCSVEKRWQAEGRTGASMRYIGLVLKGR